MYGIWFAAERKWLIKQDTSISHLSFEISLEYFPKIHVNINEYLQLFYVHYQTLEEIHV